MVYGMPLCLFLGKIFSRFPLGPGWMGSRNVLDHLLRWESWHESNILPGSYFNGKGSFNSLVVEPTQGSGRKLTNNGNHQLEKILSLIGILVAWNLQTSLPWCQGDQPAGCVACIFVACFQVSNLPLLLPCPVCACSLWKKCFFCWKLKIAPVDGEEGEGGNSQMFLFYCFFSVLTYKW